MNIIRFLILAMMLMFLIGCNKSEGNKTQVNKVEEHKVEQKEAPNTIYSKGWTSSHYQEDFRPQLNYTPVKNWINDPNGLVFWQGTYHMYYQYNPEGNKWGHISWGHATSKDLIHWQEQPVAIPERVNPNNSDDTEMIFSGSIIVDENNVSGLGQNGIAPMLAFYTSAYQFPTEERGSQAQSLAYSLDNGQTWMFYSDNPLIAIPGNNDFRDPKVIWYEQGHKWIMLTVSALEKQVKIYDSTDLLHWRHVSDFGPANSDRGIWEVPDLFQTTVNDDPNQKKWVLIVNVNGGTRYGGSGVQYFVGEFDGTTFTAEDIHTPKNIAGDVFDDFETDYAKWISKGIAFNSGPVNDEALANTYGKKVADSYHAPLDNMSGNGDVSVGILTSETFIIDKHYINFLIAGGYHPASDLPRKDPDTYKYHTIPEEKGISTETTVNLLIDGQRVQSATGNNSNSMEWVSWDVSAYKGKTAQIEIVDLNQGDTGWGHIIVDHILFSDEKIQTSADLANWADFGRDFYAAITFNNVKAGENNAPVWVGWLNNWDYANVIPTTDFRGAQSFPRIVTLNKDSQGHYLLRQQPLNVEKLRIDEQPINLANDLVLDNTSSELKQTFEAGSLLDVNVLITPDSASTTGIDIYYGQKDFVRVIYNQAEQTIAIDRRSSGLVNFYHNFSGVHSAPIKLNSQGQLSFKLYLDWSVIQLFSEDGTTVITDLIFPDQKGNISFKPFAINGKAKIEHIGIWRLKSIWAN